VGVKVHIFSGASGGVIAPTKNYTPVTMLEIHLEANASFYQELPGDYNGFLLVLEGGGMAGAEQASIHKDEIVWLTRHAKESLSEIKLVTADTPMRLLLIAGRPLGEPVVAHGPFVMNSKEEIRQAYADYRAGLFS
ncbi:MAG: pirin-like C-terminal cupin domain-containing protein, partial [Burkholderiales bacterium]